MSKIIKAVSIILVVFLIYLYGFAYFNPELFLYYEVQPYGEYDFSIPIGRENMLIYSKSPSLAFWYDNQSFLFSIALLLAGWNFYEKYKKNKDTKKLRA